LKSLLGLAAVVAMAASPAGAQNYLLNFDAGLPGSLANAQAPAGLSFQYGELQELTDSYGDPTGVFNWGVDLTAPAVTVENPNYYGYGTAPSPQLALDSVFSPTLLLFSTPQDLGSFGLTLDNSTFGTLGLVNIEFYRSVAGGADLLLGTVAIDQTIPGQVISYGALSGVDKIVLPAGALYDDVNIAVVPEPATATLFGLGMLGLILRQRRR
jgi:hypothetical protein